MLLLLLLLLRGRVHGEACDVSAGWAVRPLPVLRGARVVGAAPQPPQLPGPPPGPPLQQQRPPPLLPGAPLPPGRVSLAPGSGGGRSRPIVSVNPFCVF